MDPAKVKVRAEALKAERTQAQQQILQLCEPVKVVHLHGRLISRYKRDVESLPHMIGELDGQAAGEFLESFHRLVDSVAVFADGKRTRIKIMGHLAAITGDPLSDPLGKLMVAEERYRLSPPLILPIFSSLPASCVI